MLLSPDIVKEVVGVGGGGGCRGLHQRPEEKPPGGTRLRSGG